MLSLIDSSGSDPKYWLGNEKHLHSLIPLVLTLRIGPCEKHLHSLIPLVLTLRIGRVMRNVYTHSFLWF